MKRSLFIITTVLVLIHGIVFAGSSLTLSQTDRTTDQLTITLTLEADAPISALSTDIMIDSASLILTDVKPEFASSGKQVISNTLAKGTMRIAVLSITDNGPLENGVVATLNCNIIQGNNNGTVIMLSHTPSASSPKGKDVEISGNSIIISF
jgi:citrate lyase gamma subunit